MRNGRFTGVLAAAIAVAGLGTAGAAPAAPAAVRPDAAWVTVHAPAARLGGGDVAAGAATVRGVEVVVHPAATQVTGLAGPSAVSVTRTVDLTALRVRLRGDGLDVAVPVTGTMPRAVTDTHLAYGSGDASLASARHVLTLDATFPVPAGALEGVTATVELAPGGMLAPLCAGCTAEVAPLDDAAAGVGAEVAARRDAHREDLRIGSWERAVPAAGGLAYQVLDVWQLRDDARHVAVESYLRVPGGAVTGRVAATRWAVAEGGAAGSGWTTTLLRRPERATSADAPYVTVSAAAGALALPVLGGQTSFFRETPGSGELLADLVPAATLAGLPAEVAAYARTNREGALQELAWGDPIAVPVAMRKTHDCVPNPNEAGPGEAIDLRMYCGGYELMDHWNGRDAYWSILRTKAHVVGVIIGHSATTRCTADGFRTDTNFRQYIDRCRFHNSEHQDESMSAQRNYSSPCYGGQCYRGSDIVPNNTWRTYDFFSCCSISLNPLNVSPAQMMSVWWSSTRAHTDDLTYGSNTASCTYAKIQPMGGTGEAGLCNWHDGISP